MDVRMNHLEFTTESKRTSDSIMRFWDMLALAHSWQILLDVPDCSLRARLDHIRSAPHRR
jgi:hypothetical protein